MSGMNRNKKKPGLSTLKQHPNTAPTEQASTMAVVRVIARMVVTSFPGNGARIRECVSKMPLSLFEYEEKEVGWVAMVRGIWISESATQAAPWM